MSRALFDRFPETRALPFVALGDLPTAVEPAPALSRAAAGPEVWIKRDDRSGALYGGNKVRKLEFLLGEAQARGAKRVWTMGAIGSHHCLATARYARHLGLGALIHHTPQPTTENVRRNCLATAATGAELHLVTTWALPLALASGNVRIRRDEGGPTHFIPIGGSSPTGALGYVNAALEIDAQIARGELPEVDEIYVPVGTAGTLAGLVVGFRAAGRRVRVVGVRVVDRVIVNRVHIDHLIRRTARLLARCGVPVRTWVGRGEYDLVHDQFGPGYGRPTEAAREAVAIAQETTGLSLELTYTGKAMAGLLARATQQGSSARRVLFIDTYSSADLSGAIPEGFGPHDLPAGYARFFEGPPEISA